MDQTTPRTRRPPPAGAADPLSADRTHTLEGLLAEIDGGRPAPCYLLYGDEEYMIQGALDRIVSRLVPEADRDFNLFFMDGDRQDTQRLCESLLTPPLIPGRKAVVVRNTLLFHSRKTLPDLVQSLRGRAKEDPAGAARDFMTFLKLTGWQLDDLRDGGWKKISDEAWRRTVDGDDGRDRAAWLPALVQSCVEQGLQTATAGDDGDLLSDTLAAGLPGGNCLILTAESVDKRKRIYRTLAERGRVLHFSRIASESKRGEILMKGARGLLAAKGKKLDRDAWLALGRKTGFSLRASMTALEKLITFAGEKAEIGAEDVEAVIGKTREEGVFHLTAALMERDLPGSLRLLKDLLDQGEHPLMILASLAREIRLLLQAQLLLESGCLGDWRPGMDYFPFQKAVYPAVKELAGPSAPHPYVVYQGLKNAPRFPRARLLAHLDALVAIDLAMKTTAKDPRLMLERFLLQVCSPGESAGTLKAF